MSELLATLSTELGDAVETAGRSIVQLQGRRRLVAGVVIDTNLIATLAHAVDGDSVAVQFPDGRTGEGAVVGHTPTGLAFVRVKDADATLTAIKLAPEPRPGELALAVGRTWSGNIFSQLAPVSVVGGPLRTGRRGELARVIRVGVAPHGALSGGALVSTGGAFLGLVTPAAIRGTTVVIPSSIVTDAAKTIVARGDAKQGFIGVASLPVALPPRQQIDGRDRGVLVTAITPDGPADSAGLLVGDVIVGFGGTAVRDHDELLELLRGNHVGQPVAIAVVRGGAVQTVTVTVQERRGV